MRYYVVFPCVGVLCRDGRVRRNFDYGDSKVCVKELKSASWARTVAKHLYCSGVKAIVRACPLGYRVDGDGFIWPAL